MARKYQELLRRAAWIGEVKAVQSSWNAVKGVHGFIQQKFFEGEAPTLYRLKGNKYSHCYGAPKRGTKGPNMAPYIAGAVMTGLAVFFIVLPISFNRNYAASKQRYEAFARENAEIFERQFDRGQFSREGRPKL
ncbi:Reverse transcriptase domain-containing protein [Durusdinium trenchii]|uniref:Reverse transcriptase domain-containing protein n=1 Tax=Durusdinium trenchii TaxID=1381693 RepID=A0ABP0R3Q9_9DINO